jgi:hypothetical protein
MRTKRRTTIEDLRTAIQALPRRTRIAMLDGIRDEPIIVGAYAHRDGICPMLAAHRRGGRTNLISFARAWDRFAYTGARVTGPRPATARELLVLRTQLEASLLEEEAPESDLASAITQHRELVSRRQRAEQALLSTCQPRREPVPPARRRERVGDPNRTQELRLRPGWAWLRPVRRYDEYRWALERVQGRATEAQTHTPQA